MKKKSEALAGVEEIKPRDGVPIPDVERHHPKEHAGKSSVHVLAMTLANCEVGQSVLIPHTAARPDVSHRQLLNMVTYAVRNAKGILPEGAKFTTRVLLPEGALASERATMKRDIGVWRVK